MSRNPSFVRPEFPFKLSMLIYPLLGVMVIWLVYWTEVRFGYNFTNYGVRPRTLQGLRGIVFSPFIHSDGTHLWHNTLPFLILSLALFYFYNRIAWMVVVWAVLLSGFGTWLIGRPSYHIGMSGVIYALVAFLFFKGIWAKHYRLIALSLLVVFLYGSLIWGTLPLKDEISWEGHLSGFIAGFLLGLRFRESVPSPPKYAWEAVDYDVAADPFMRHFDEEGNFIESLEIEEENIEIHYDFKEEE